jgi:hypothetical protein
MIRAWVKGGSVMRRRLGRYLPIVLIALTVQIFAPIAACWAATLAASDPFAKALICSPSGKAGQADQNGRDHRSGCCAVCCVTQAAVLLDEPDPAVFTVPQRTFHRVIWRESSLHVPTCNASAHAQARAPPAIS